MKSNNKNVNAKLKRRMNLLDDLLDYTVRSYCCFSMCDGPLAPIKNMKTCTRCACIHRAIQMGLIIIDNNKYMIQHSVIDGRKI